MDIQTIQTSKASPPPLSVYQPSVVSSLILSLPARCNQMTPNGPRPSDPVVRAQSPGWSVRLLTITTGRCSLLGYQWVPSGRDSLICTAYESGSLPWVPPPFEATAPETEQFGPPPHEIVEYDNRGNLTNSRKRARSGGISGMYNSTDTQTRTPLSHISADEDRRQKKQCSASDPVPSTASMPVSTGTRSHRALGTDSDPPPPKPSMQKREVPATAASLILEQLKTLVEEDEDSERVKDRPAPSLGWETYPLGMYLVPRFVARRPLAYGRSRGYSANGRTTRRRRA